MSKIREPRNGTGHDSQEHPMRRSLSMLAACLLAAPFAFAVCGCGHQSTVASESKAPEEAAVAVGHPTQGTIHYVVEQPGRIEAFEQTPIYAKIPGYVKAVRVDIGDRVKRNDLLVELNVPEVVESHHAKQALVTQAQLGVSQSERSINVTQASISTAQADLDVARAAREKTQATVKRWASECQRKIGRAHV